MDPIPLAQATLLPPVEPSKIVCVGRNYREHAAELGHDVPVEPLLFFKPPSRTACSGSHNPAAEVSRAPTTRASWALSSAVARGGCATTKMFCPYILGYTCVDDFTARDLQNKDGQWTRAKGFDTFCPVGPLVIDGLDPWAGVQVETRVNGEVWQSGNTRDFIFALDIVIRYISQIMTLEPGDLIATGTPKGVGPVVAGDVVEVSIEGVGTLRNPVADEG